jgi:hypothetical protein
MCTAEWRSSNEGEKRRKKTESFPDHVPGDFIRAAGHLRKTYFGRSPHVTIFVRCPIGERHRRGELPSLESCSAAASTDSLQQPGLTSLASACVVEGKQQYIPNTSGLDQTTHLRVSPQWCVDHQHVPDGPPPVTSPESERCARAWGSPISSSS